MLEYQEIVGDSEEPSLDSLARIQEGLETLPHPPENLKGELLPRVFNAKDPLGKQSRGLLSNVIRKVERARELNAKADSLLVPGCELAYDTIEPIIVSNSQELAPTALNIPLDDLAIKVDATEHALRQFGRIVSNVNFKLLSIQSTSLGNFDAKLYATRPLNLLDQSVHNICAGAVLLSQETSRLGQSLNRVKSIANRRSIEFDGSPATIAQLGRPDGVEGVLPGVLVNDAVISIAQEAAESFLPELTLSELNRRHQELSTLHDQIGRVLGEIGGYAKQLGIPFDYSQNSLIRLSALGLICSQAPADLLDFRKPSLSHPNIIEIINAAEEAQTTEKLLCESLANNYYLDALPSIEELKSAIRTFRRGDSLFNFFNSEWRAAKKLYKGISKAKVKCSASDYEREISNIVKWIEHKAAFIGNTDFKESLGPLFKGLDTDYSKIRRLHSWYIDSHAEILKHPGFIESVNLSAIESQKLIQLAALYPRIREIVAELDSHFKAVSRLLVPISSQLESSLEEAGWENYEKHLIQITEYLQKVTTQLGRLVKPEISSKRALEILNAKLELVAASDDFEALNHGQEEIHGRLEPLLPGISSISCIRWEDYLQQLTELANATTILGDSLHEYGDSDTNPRIIRDFIESKLALDSGLAQFASLPEKASTHNWESYVRIVTSRVDSANGLIKLLRPAGPTGITAEGVITGLKARNEADKLIDTLSADTSVNVILQNLFQGIETDLVSLAATLSWGESVIGNRPVQISSLCPVLLCKDADINFQWANKHLRQLVQLREDITTNTNQLSKFGKLEWEGWNWAGNGQDHSRFASSILERIELAASNISAVLPWSKYNVECINCKKLGLPEFVLVLEKGLVPSDTIGSVFEFVAYRSIGRKIYKSFSELEGFTGTTHENRRAEFVSLDKEIINLTGKSFAYQIDKDKVIPDGDAGY